MTLSLLNDNTWLGIINREAQARNEAAIGKLSGVLVFKPTVSDIETIVIDSAIPLGPVRLLKINLGTLFPNPINLNAITDIDYRPYDDVTLFGLVCQLLGLTDLDYDDVIIGKVDNRVVYTIDRECVKYRGSFEVDYENQ